MSRTSGSEGSDSDRLVVWWAVEYRAAMQGVARRLTGDPDLVEDMAQEATIQSIANTASGHFPSTGW